MALSGRKPRKLDAICAKLKQINQESLPGTPSLKEDREEGKGVPNETINNGFSEKEETEMPSDLSMKSRESNGTLPAGSGLAGCAADEDSIRVGTKSSPSPVPHTSCSSSSSGGPVNHSTPYQSKSFPVLNQSSSSRRKSRKALTPRNIAQFQGLYEPCDSIDEKDELAEYEINNQNTNFPPDEELDDFEKDASTSGHESLEYTNDNGDDSNSSSFDQSSNKQSTRYRPGKGPNSSSQSLGYVSLAGAPLDLSVATKDDSSTSVVHNGYLSSDDNDDVNNNKDRQKAGREEPDMPTDLSLAGSEKKSESKEQASNLKDYAETTMNELISMYGFGGSQELSNISRQIPMSKYSDILQQAHEAMAMLSSGRMGQRLPAPPMVPRLPQSMKLGDQKVAMATHLAPNVETMTADNMGPSQMEGLKGVTGNKFTNSAAYISAVFNNNGPAPLQPKLAPSTSGKTLLPDYTKYLKRFGSSQECGGSHCKELGYKEHYHCIDCNFHVFLKKEEMVRHYKWHKKREESLQHGFLRFSPLDDCTHKFGPCTHNGRQTHYHCLQGGCDKVYISTSDVQMHANYHRKDSAIIQEGFQRFRATEDCGTPTCAFYGQRTTHFHCRRSSCKFTFKNKADMEKHKSYHQKDEILGRDGFKKFMKYEHCSYNSCRYSKISNHIHCIRTGCNYVLHSTAQLYSHKRKHERRDFENAYRKYRENQSRPTLLPAGASAAGAHPPGASQSEYTTITHTKGVPTMPIKRPADLMEPLELKKPKLEPMSGPSSPAYSDGASTPFEAHTPNMDGADSSMEEDGSNSSDRSESIADKCSLSGDSLSSSLNLPIPLLATSAQDLKPSTTLISSTMGGIPATLPTIPQVTVPSTSLFVGGSPILQPPKTVYMERREKDDTWKTYLVRYTANDPCNPRCQYLYKDHYHCKMGGCLVLFKSKDGVREHARFHELQDRITPIAYRVYEHTETCPEVCQYSCKEKHYHCIWSGCTHVVPHVGPTFGRLEHYRIHEYARAAAGKAYNRSTGKGLEDNSMRRRGRPPKYPKSDLPKIPKVVLSDEEIRKSHVTLKEGEVPQNTKVINGFRVFTETDPCPDAQCSYYGHTHFHCARPRCYTITDRIDVLNLHAKDFHSFVKILEGFEFFDRNVSCRRRHCPNNQTNRHFHCIRPRCDYSFVRHSTMAQHEKKHIASDEPALGLGSKLETSPVSHSFVPIAPASGPLGRTPVVGPSGNFLPVSATSIGVVPSAVLAHSGSLPITAHSGMTPVLGHAAGSTPVIAHAGPTPVLAHAGSAPMLAHSAGTPLVAPIPQVSVNLSPMSLAISPVQALPASVSASSVSSPIVASGGAVPLTVPAMGSGIPLTMLLQKGSNEIPQPSWADLKAKMHYALTQLCGRPFCKLKKKDHYHCFECNQAFSDPARLRSHIGKHGIKLKRSENGARVVKSSAAPVSIAPRPTENLPASSLSEDVDPDEAKCLAEGGEMSGASDAEDELKGSSSLNLNPSTFSEMITKAQEQNRITSVEGNQPGGSENGADTGNQSAEDEENSMLDDSLDSGETATNNTSRSGRKRTRTKHDDFVDSNAINVKQRRVSSPRGSKDDSVPPGYSRSRYNEDCTFPKCAYRQSVTHFHCLRDDCGYGFSDRSRLVQHTLRHERIDSITGGQMQQYRINQNCGRDDCEFNNKMSHFHCLRCNYSCTDSSKVLTHRKHHAKLDDINSQGFQKYSVTEGCDMPSCVYSQKQTHYHCLQDNCKTAILGPAQMSPHKLKHANQ